MRNYFVFDGVDSRTLGIYTNGTETCNSPSREFDFYQVPGRDGDLLGLSTRLSNTELTYHCYIYKNFKANIAALRGLLLSRTSYCRLSDTYNPDEYRLALFQGPLNVEPTRLGDAGQFDITFIVKPQRYYNSGDVTVTVEGGDAATLSNPSQFIAKPLVVLNYLEYNSTGVFQMSNTGGSPISYNITVYADRNAPTGIYTFDSELMEITDADGNNAEQHFRTQQWLGEQKHPYPYFDLYDSYFSVMGADNEATVTPRWWTV